MKRILAAGLILLSALASAQKPQKVIYPAEGAEKQGRFTDLVEILELALEKTLDEFGPYELAPASSSMAEPRQSRELQNNSGRLNVMWWSTAEPIEEALRPIRIPLRQGLLSFRIALIHKDDQARLNDVHSIEDLRELKVGQGLGWGDVAVFEHHGIPVVESGYDNLFAMLDAGGRFDLFPRGVTEIFGEYERFSEEFKNLAVEENLLIFYPWPHYLFVSPDNEALAKRLETGLELMVEDGSLTTILQSHYGEAIERAALHERRVIDLHNPRLPEATPLEDERLWFHP